MSLAKFDEEELLAEARARPISSISAPDISMGCACWCVPTKCHYWNFQLGNVWAESLDHRFSRVHINNSQAVYRDDGSFELAVAHADPGHANWISTAGHEHGTMGLRWVLADAHPAPRTRVVKISEMP